VTGAALSLLTYNMHKGFSGDGRRAFVLGRMREALAASGADVVFLQEAQGAHAGHARRLAGWPREAQFEFLADRLWPHHAYGRNGVYDHGHHGNAVLSRYPLKAWENIDVSPWPFAASRSLLHARITPPGFASALHLVCIHFGFVGQERRQQVRRLARHVEEHVPAQAPLLVAGDFNDWSGRAERDFSAALGLREVFRELHGRHARTFPAWAPLLPMDRIYCRGLAALRAECLHGASWRGLSDHVPLMAWFAAA